MTQTEVVTQLEIQLKHEWAQAMHAKRQEDYRLLKAKAIETYNKLRKQRELMKGL